MQTCKFYFLLLLFYFPLFNYRATRLVLSIVFYGTLFFFFFCFCFCFSFFLFFLKKDSAYSLQILTQFFGDVSPVGGKNQSGGAQPVPNWNGKAQSNRFRRCFFPQCVMTISLCCCIDISFHLPQSSLDFLWTPSESQAGWVGSSVLERSRIFPEAYM